MPKGADKLISSPPPSVPPDPSPAVSGFLEGLGPNLPRIPPTEAFDAVAAASEYILENTEEDNRPPEEGFCTEGSFFAKTRLTIDTVLLPNGFGPVVEKMLDAPPGLEKNPAPGRAVAVAVAVAPAPGSAPGTSLRVLRESFGPRRELAHEKETMIMTQLNEDNLELSDLFLLVSVPAKSSLK